jgi:arginine-tRNA-protein transferase
VDPRTEGGLGGAAERSHRRRTQVLARAIAAHSPSPGEAFGCPYLHGRQARHLTLLPEPLEPGVYHALMDLNFRRLGPVFYRPQCQACDECRMIRVPVAEFRPSRAQRRCRERNRDVSVEVVPPRPSDEKHALYRRYLSSRHDGQMDGSPVEFRGFLYASEVATIEVVYRAEGRLLGVALVDVEPLALSAVYCYFDPAQAWRSPGVFNVLWLIEECRRRGAPYLYLGYYVRDSPKMSYKARYRPHEILGADGRWRLATASRG